MVKYSIIFKILFLLLWIKIFDLLLLIIAGYIFKKKSIRDIYIKQYEADKEKELLNIQLKNERKKLIKIRNEQRKILKEFKRELKQLEIESINNDEDIKIIEEKISILSEKYNKLLKEAEEIK